MSLEDKKLQEIILFLLTYDDFKEALYKIQTSDSKIFDKNVTRSPNSYNVIRKNQSQEELIFDIIERIKEIKTQCLQKLKSLLLQDKIIKSRIQPFRLKQVLKIYEEGNLNLSKPITFKELKIHT